RSEAESINLLKRKTSESNYENNKISKQKYIHVSNREDDREDDRKGDCEGDRKNSENEDDREDDISSIGQDDKAQNLKKNFLKTTQEELITENQLFLNNLVKSFLTKDFERLFLNDEEVTINQQIELPGFLNKDTDSIYAFFKSWVSLFEKLGSAKHTIEEASKFLSYKVLRGLISKKIQELFGISNRHKRRYWAGAWRLIELLHITACPATIFIKAGLSANYLMSASNNKYDKFLQSLLNNDQVYHQTPKFNALVIQNILNL
ncbi:25964_t:CDS:2, partial [Dentiscutata erythropus]